MENINIVVRNIENVRKKKGVTKVFIARSCKKTPGWYGDIVKGKNRLSVDDFLIIADSLGENPAIFFSNKLSVSLNKSVMEAI